MNSPFRQDQPAIRLRFLLCGWGLAALIWGSYFYFQQAKNPLNDVNFAKYLLAGAVVFSFWLVAVPGVGRLAFRFPIFGQESRRNLVIHFLLAPVVFVAHMIWLALVAPTTFAIFGWDTWSAYWSRLTIADFFFNVRGPVDIVLYWATILGFGALEYYRRFHQRDQEASRLEEEIDVLKLDFARNSSRQDSSLKRIPIKAADRAYMLEVSDIDWIEAADTYVIIHAGGKRHLLRERMKWFEEQLAPTEFFRVHRQAIVNLKRVREIRPGESADFVLVLASGAKVPLSRRRRRDFEQILGRSI